MKKLHNRFKILFLYYMYTDNIEMMEYLGTIIPNLTKEEIDKLSFDVLKNSVFTKSDDSEFLKEIQENETKLRWYMLFVLGCENDNEEFLEVLDQLNVKIQENHPNAIKMLDFLEKTAINIFELKESENESTAV